jgi:transposase
MNTKLHAICDSQGRPLDLFVTAGQVSDYIGARALLGGLPKVEWLLGDRGYDADWFRDALKDKGIRACIPGRKQRKKTVKYDKRRYKRRNRIEIMFGRLKDWRRVATRYDRCPKVFLSAIALAAVVIYWLLERVAPDKIQDSHVVRSVIPCLAGRYGGQRWANRIL